MIKVIGKWSVTALLVLWIIAEVVSVTDHSAATWPLTQVIITYVPPWLGVPAVLFFSVWLSWHIITNYLARRLAKRAVVLALALQARLAVESGLPACPRCNTPWSLHGIEVSWHRGVLVAAAHCGEHVWNFGSQ